MICFTPLVVYADVSDQLSGWDFVVESGSNAISDYSVAPLSSLGTVTNTVGTNIKVGVFYHNSAGTYKSKYVTPEFRNGRFYVSTDIPDGYIDNVEYLVYKDSLPIPGGYKLSFDFTSDFAFDSYRNVRIRSSKFSDNAETTYTMDDVPSYDQFSGDLYIPPFEISLSGNNWVLFKTYIKDASSTGLKNWGGSFAIHFTPAQVSSGAISTGPDTSQQDYQYGVSNTLNQIDDSLRNLIQHISDQLAALWDQMFNLMHLPHMAKMDELIAAIRKVANDVDMSQVVDTIEDTTAHQIANDNANTSKVEQAVEKHGNFIIDGLKGLFIPSDEYFKTYFDDLYEYFSDRFGFLSFPIDLLSRLVDLFVNSSDVDCVLTLPGFEISGEQVWTDQSFNLTEFMETNFSFVLTAIRTVTSVYLIMAFVDLCREKWNEVMSN